MNVNNIDKKVSIDDTFYLSLRFRDVLYLGTYLDIITMCITQTVRASERKDIQHAFYIRYI